MLLLNLGLSLRCVELIACSRLDAREQTCAQQVKGGRQEETTVYDTGPIEVLTSSGPHCVDGDGELNLSLAK